MKTTNFKSYGLSQTFIGDNYHDFKWDADYSGENLNIALSEKLNGEGGSYFIELSPEDLTNLISKPSSSKSLEERLEHTLAGLTKKKKHHTKKKHHKKHSKTQHRHRNYRHRTNKHKHKMSHRRKSHSKKKFK